MKQMLKQIPKQVRNDEAVTLNLFQGLKKMLKRVQNDTIRHPELGSGSFLKG